MKPGVYAQTNEVYHKGIGYSSTNLIDLISYSPAHMKFWKDNPQESTTAMNEGTMLHEALLEPSVFESKYFVADARTKEGKAAIEANKGMVKVTQSQMDKVKKMYETVTKTTDIQKFIKGAELEKSYYWRDPDTDILCKCKPDILNLEYGIIFDIKTIDSGSMWNVKRAVRDYKYYLSNAFYKDGVNIVLGGKVTEFVLLFIEKEAPHGVRKIILSIDDIQKGFNEYKEALTTIKKCTDSGVWPNYPDEVVELNVFGGKNE